MTRVVSYIAAFALAVSAFAQDAPNVRGHVVSPAGIPIPGVEVRLEGVGTLTRTDEGGAFSLVKAPKGYQMLQFRRIGYLPATIPVKVPETSDSLKVMMVPMPPTLDTVQVVAHLNVLAGIVLDPKNRPIAGATVDMIGSKTGEATTDEGGWFTFTSVKSGLVVVRARKPGYEMAMYSLRLEDWRGLVLRMDTLATKMRSATRADVSGIGNAVEFAWTETRQRIAMRGSRATIVTREELAPFSDMSLGEAVRHTESGSMLTVDLQNAGTNVCVVQDGKQLVGSTTLDMWRADDVDFVELYPPGTETSGSVARYTRGGGCRPVRTPGQRSRGVFYAVVWMR
jgi:hypothetical protein